MNQLIDRALSVPTRHVSRRHRVESVREQAEFALAFLDRRITGQQAAVALGCTRANVHCAINGMLTKAMAAGVINLELVKQAPDAEK